MTEHIVLLVIAGLFAVVTGANDGSSILAPGITFKSLRTGSALGILTVTIVLVPFVSTRVATTFTQDLVDFRESNAIPLMMVAVVGAMIVVGALALLGLPTSLGLAVIGGIVGVGIGAGSTVEWAMVVMVLVTGAVAPLMGGVFGYLFMNLSRLLPLSRRISSMITVAHRLTFLILCVAYSFNGAQKMLAVFAIAAGTGITTAVQPEPSMLVLMAVCFAIGSAIGLPAVSSKLSFGLYSVRPPQTLAAELSASVATLGSTSLGAPVSMTQAITGGLVGAGVGTGPARVRWKIASRMGLAWLVTLPSSTVITAMTVFVMRTAG